MLQVELVEAFTTNHCTNPTNSAVSFTGPAWFAITLQPNPAKRLAWEKRGFMGPFTRAPPTLNQPSTIPHTLAITITITIITTITITNIITITTTTAITNITTITIATTITITTIIIT